MRELTDAYRAALSATGGEPVRGRAGHVRAERDIASFTVDALPVVAFEGLALVAAALGDVADEDPPYSIDFLVREEGGVWCRCDIVPDAGGSTVSVTVLAVEGTSSIGCEAMRDVLVAELNALDWPSVG